MEAKTNMNSEWKLPVLFGKVISFLAVGSVIIFAVDQWSTLSASLNFTPRTAVIFFVITISYAVMMIPMGIGWRFLLSSKDVSVGLGWAVVVYGETQLNKYLPGNIFQFVGRHIEVGKVGGSQKSVLWASLMELLSLLICSVFLSVFFLLVLTTWDSFVGKVILYLLPAAFLLACLRGNELAVFMACYFSAIMAIALTLLGGVWLIQDVESLYTITSVKILFVGLISWLAGLFTPGSPGGLGVREALIVLLGSDFSSPPQLLVLAVVSRLCCVAGDVLHFVMSKLLRKIIKIPH